MTPGARPILAYQSNQRGEVVVFDDGTVLCWKGSAGWQEGAKLFIPSPLLAAASDSALSVEVTSLKELLDEASGEILRLDEAGKLLDRSLREANAEIERLNHLRPGYPRDAPTLPPILPGEPGDQARAPVADASGSGSE